MAYDDDNSFPGVKLAPGGQAPVAFIMHHTAGRGDPASVVNFWKKQGRGYGSQYIMDRNGVIHDVQKEFGYGGANEILNGTGVGKGLNNSNVVGMEIVANNDADVTPAQAQAAAAFIQARYPNTPVFGHGQVNAGHKEATEGMTAIAAVNALRGSSAQPTATAFAPNQSIASAPAARAIAANAPPGDLVGTSLASSPFGHALMMAESSGRDIYSGIDKDYPGMPNSRSQGFWQIDTPTWQQFGKLAGIDLQQYPHALGSPADIQAQVAALIPMSRFGGITQEKLRRQFGPFNASATVGQLASQFGGPSPNNYPPAAYQGGNYGYGPAAIQTSNAGTVTQPAGSPGSVLGQTGGQGGVSVPTAALDPNAAGTGTIPGFGTKAASDKFTGGLTSTASALGGGSGGGEGGGGSDAAQPPPPLALNLPQAHRAQYTNPNQMLQAAMQGYLSGMVPAGGPLTWGAQPPGVPPYMGAGAVGAVPGLQGAGQLAQMSNMMTDPFGYYSLSLGSMPGAFG